MEKKYVKPEMAIENIEVENMIATSPGIVDGEYAEGGSTGLSKDREEWVMDTDLWGNESWSRSN